MRSALILFLCVLNGFGGDWQPGKRKEFGDLPGGASVWEQEFKKGDEIARVSGITFKTSELDLAVVDNPPEGAIRLSEAAPESGGIAGCNASYFHADGRPLGLVIQEGKTTHGFERAKLLSGILAVRKGRVELVRSGDFRPGEDIRHAIQAGPWLIEGGQSITGLDGIKRARRTIVATDGKGNWGLLATTPVSLSTASELLSAMESAGRLRVRSALNLDGGSSTALWAGAVGLSIPEFGTVRNFLVLRPKSL